MTNSPFSTLASAAQYFERDHMGKALTLAISVQMVAMNRNPKFDLGLMTRMLPDFRLIHPVSANHGANVLREGYEWGYPF